MNLPLVDPVIMEALRASKITTQDLVNNFDYFKLNECASGITLKAHLNGLWTNVARLKANMRGDWEDWI